MTLAAANDRRKLRLPHFIAILVLAALPLAVTQFASAHGAKGPQRHQEGPKPTIVLEHGAWADGSSWSGVIERLQRRGYTVAAPPNPLRGLGYDSRYLADFLSTLVGPVIVVGHSYGGAVITDAATGNPNVKALVYVDAFIPAEGESLMDLLGAKPGSCIGGDPAKTFRFAPYPDAPEGDVDLYLQTQPNQPYPGFARCFANGVPADQAAALAASQRPLALDATSAPSGPPAWQTIPSWSVIGELDRVLPPAEQQAMSQRAGAHITTLPAGHLSLVSKPSAVTGVIVRAVRATD